MPGIDHVVLPAGPYILQPPAESEAGQALALLMDPDVTLWNLAPTVTTLEAARDWCRRGRDWSRGDHATWSVLTADGRLVGNVSPPVGRAPTRSPGHRLTGGLSGPTIANTR